MYDIYKSIIISFYDAMSNRDFEKLASFLQEDAVFEFPGAKICIGEKRVLLLLTMLTRKYTVLNFSVSECIVEDESVCAIWTNSGISTAGEDYSNSGVTVFRFRDDKIIFLSDYFKDTSFVK
ncbi:MAG: nuclear transport factor 2 family protein [Lutibacter sp.]|jgi:ketosteroid isomerase-like protein|nr:nuclear transport factor 2 family protein [Lutibacter sp.]